MKEIKKLITYALIIILIGGALLYFLPNEQAIIPSQKEIVDNPVPEQPTPAPSPIPETDPQSILITEILTELETWKNKESKSNTKKAIKKAISSLNSNNSQAIKVNDLEHLLTHYGREQSKLLSLLSKYKASYLQIEILTLLSDWKDRNQGQKIAADLETVIETFNSNCHLTQKQDQLTNLLTNWVERKGSDKNAPWTVNYQRLKELTEQFKSC